jgi:DNA repair protein RecO (recombination protein O)
VRKTTSRFGGRLEPLSHVSLLCWQGRELDIVNQAEVLDSFRQVREDLSRVTKAFSMLEVADRVSVERHSTPRLYELLVNALASLAATTPRSWSQPSS